MSKLKELLGLDDGPKELGDILKEAFKEEAEANGQSTYVLPSYLAAASQSVGLQEKIGDDLKKYEGGKKSMREEDINSREHNAMNAAIGTLVMISTMSAALTPITAGVSLAGAGIALLSVKWMLAGRKSYADKKNYHESDKDKAAREEAELARKNVLNELRDFGSKFTGQSTPSEASKQPQAVSPVMGGGSISKLKEFLGLDRGPKELGDILKDSLKEDAKAKGQSTYVLPSYLAEASQSVGLQEKIGDDVNKYEGWKESVRKHKKDMKLSAAGLAVSTGGLLLACALASAVAPVAATVGLSLGAYFFVKNGMKLMSGELNLEKDDEARPEADLARKNILKELQDFGSRFSDESGSSETSKQPQRSHPGMKR